MENKSGFQLRKDRWSPSKLVLTYYQRNYGNSWSLTKYQLYILYKMLDKYFRKHNIINNPITVKPNYIRRFKEVEESDDICT